MARHSKGSVGKEKRKKSTGKTTEESLLSHEVREVISVENLVKKYGDFTAIDKMTFSIGEGAIFGFVGPNGAGKTTTVKILTGQLKPTAGTAKVLGVDVAGDPMELKRRIGILPEIEMVPSFLTPREFLEFACTVRGVENAQEKIERWIDFFDLDEKRNEVCRELSRGMRQRVMLASATIHEPKVLFLDEPLLNLDPIYQKKLREFLLEYAKKGNTIFLCTHILEMAEKMCTHVCVINRGKIMKMATAATLKSEGKSLEQVFLEAVSQGAEVKT